MKVAQHKKAAGILMGAIGGEKDFQIGDMDAGRIDDASSGLCVHVVVVVCVAVLLLWFDVVDRGSLRWGGGLDWPMGVEITMGYGERGFTIKDLF